MSNEAREIAGKLGQTKYVSGTACKRGHMGPRYVSTGNCIECSKRFHNGGGSAPISKHVAPVQVATLYGLTIPGIERHTKQIRLAAQQGITDYCMKLVADAPEAARDEIRRAFEIALRGMGSA